MNFKKLFLILCCSLTIINQSQNNITLKSCLKSYGFLAPITFFGLIALKKLKPYNFKFTFMSEYEKIDVSNLLCIGIVGTTLMLVEKGLQKL